MQHATTETECGEVWIRQFFVPRFIYKDQQAICIFFKDAHRVGAISSVWTENLSKVGSPYCPRVLRTRGKKFCQAIRSRLTHGLSRHSSLKRKLSIAVHLGLMKTILLSNYFDQNVHAIASRALRQRGLKISKSPKEPQTAKFALVCWVFCFGQS